MIYEAQKLPLGWKQPQTEPGHSCENGLVLKPNFTSTRLICSPCPVCRPADYRAEGHKILKLRLIVVALIAIEVLLIVAGFRG